ncbi:hypothetical protein VCHA38O209_20287 [Vibrio chagasii]|nr:hypothetical protein VCHA38O209_20287 [Vibrio chagasii]
MNTYELARYSATHYIKDGYMQIMGNRELMVFLLITSLKSKAMRACTVFN